MPFRSQARSRVANDQVEGVDFVNSNRQGSRSWSPLVRLSVVDYMALVQRTGNENSLDYLFHARGRANVAGGRLGKANGVRPERCLTR